MKTSDINDKKIAVHTLTQGVYDGVVERVGCSDEENSWNLYKELTCIALEGGCLKYGTKGWFGENNYKIITAEYFLNERLLKPKSINWILRYEIPEGALKIVYEEFTSEVTMIKRITELDEKADHKYTPFKVDGNHKVEIKTSVKIKSIHE